VAAFAGTAIGPGNQVDHVLAAGTPSLELDPPRPSIRNIEVNLVGSYYTSWLGLYYLRLPGSQPNQPSDKNLLFCASIGAYMDSPRASTYPASKFGVRGLFRSTRAQTQQLGVRCNLLAPWFFDTPLIAPIKHAMAARGIDMAKVLSFTTVEACVETATYCAANPGLHGEIANPQRELAHTDTNLQDVHWLCSQRARLISRTIWRADGEGIRCVLLCSGDEMLGLTLDRNLISPSRLSSSLSCLKLNIISDCASILTDLQV
jgi:NAD(P)-dependent dehydrogenase (short-subunit alcohol dehydrogenase family)